MENRNPAMEDNIGNHEGSSSTLLAGYDDRGQQNWGSLKFNLGDLATPSATDVSRMKQIFLHSLMLSQDNAQGTKIRAAAHGTCDWLLEQWEYEMWLDRDLAPEHHGILWIKGKPGAGKSTLLKHALKRIRETSVDAIALSFFFDSSGSALQKPALGLYSSLIHQLLLQIPSLQDFIIPILLQNRKWCHNATLDLEGLEVVFTAAIRGLERHHQLICFIDGLDLCEREEMKNMVRFLDQLGEVAQLSEKFVRTCISSRSYPTKNSNSFYLCIDEQGGHNKDISTYVEDKLMAPPSRQVDEIKAEVIGRASGIFQWVVLVVKNLNRAYEDGQVHALQRQLSNIQDEFIDFLAGVWTRGAEVDEESSLCMQLILFARRPLKREELYFAVMSGIGHSNMDELNPDMASTEIIDRHILKISKGLAEVVKDQTVQFIHETVRDFLLRVSSTKLGPNFANIAGQCEEDLKRCCHQYLEAGTLMSLLKNMPSDAVSEADGYLRDQLSRRFPFLKYAVSNVFIHANNAQDCGIWQGQFLSDLGSHGNLATRVWISLNNILQPHQYSYQASLLHIFAHENLISLVQLLLENNVDVDAIGEGCGSALQAASAKGHADIVRLLITAGADVNLAIGDYDDPLSAALIGDHVAVVELLLEGGSNLCTDTERSQLRLLMASRYGYEALVYQILTVNPDIDPNFKIADGEASLWWAAHNGHEAIVKLLWRDPRIDHSSVDALKQTPLFIAAMRGHATIVQFLLTNPEIDPNSPNDVGQTPLFIAAQSGHEAVVQLLIENPRVDLYYRDNFDSAPIDVASKEGHNNIVGLLRATLEVGPWFLE